MFKSRNGINAIYSCYFKAPYGYYQNLSGQKSIGFRKIDYQFSKYYRNGSGRSSQLYLGRMHNNCLKGSKGVPAYIFGS